MKIPIDCPNCNHENNISIKKLKPKIELTYKKCKTKFTANFTKKDLKDFGGLDDTINSIFK